MDKSDNNLKCVTLLEGGAKNWGKHILLPFGVTLCGQPTYEAKNQFAALKNENMADLMVNYKEEDWNITCKKCLQAYDIIMKSKESRKNCN
jgi:hypothetical protein